jgi:citrate synthase
MAEELQKPQWGTITTKVAPNSLVISGYKLDEIIANSTLLETAHLIVATELPSEEVMQNHHKAATSAAMIPAPPIERFPGEDISKTLAKCLLMDKELAEVAQTGDDGPVNKTIFALGRFARYLAKILGNDAALDQATPDEPFANYIYRAVTGESDVDLKRSQMVETMIVASVDHGVTPPSAQAGMIAASVRAEYAMSIASGVGAITDIHGGAGKKAAEFFQKCGAKADEDGIELKEATAAVIKEYKEEKKRIQGLGHRVHTEDPRRSVLWDMVEANGFAGPCVAVSKMVTDVFTEVSGKTLPINVDGVIGAIVADMGLDIDLAKALFVFGRVAGLSAHYFEEIASQRPMRRINFGDAVYTGKELRDFPVRK